MPTPNFVILYVDSPAISGAFYTELLGRKPVEASPNFVMFALDGGLMLGLWARHDVKPEANNVGGAELAVAVADKSAVDAAFADWRARGLKIAQAPVDLDFGRTFVALDPDGHRLRVFAPG